MRSTVLAAEEDDILEIDEAGITNVSEGNLDHISQQLCIELNTWLSAQGFLKIERHMRSQLHPTEDIRMILETNNEWLRHLPWHKWEIFQDYRKADIALSQPEYKCRQLPQCQVQRNKIRILAILGNNGIMEYLPFKKQADECLQQEKYLEAIKLYQQCLEVNHEDFSNYCYLGLAYFLEGEEETGENIWMSSLLEIPFEQIDNYTAELINILENYLIKYSQNNQIERTIKLYHVLKNINSDYHHEKIVEQLNQHLDRFVEEAIAAALIMEFKIAERKYQEILSVNDRRAEAWHGLGLVYYQTERDEEAYHAVTNALDLDPNKGLYHYSLGLIYEEQKPELAFSSYTKAIELDQKLPNAFTRLGNLFRNSGQYEEAEKIYNQGIEANPDDIGCYVNLANLLVERKNYQQAITIYKKILNDKQYQNNLGVFQNLAVALAKNNQVAEANLYQAKFYKYKQEFKKAIDKYQEFFKNNKGDVSVYRDLGVCYRDQYLVQQEIDIYQQGIKTYPEAAILYVDLIIAYQRAGEVNQAITTINKAFQLFPQSLTFHVLNQCLLPTIYNNTEDLDYYRSRYLKLLDDLVERVLSSEENQKRMPECIYFPYTYYMNYRGENDKEIQSKYATMMAEVMKFNYPQWSQDLPLPSLTAQQKIKIGYISCRLSGLGSLSLGWLKHSDRSKFEIYSYQIGFANNPQQEQYNLYSDRHYQIDNNVEEICQQIYQDKLHILVLLDVGLEPTMYKIAGLRLAPIQCATWLHPVTSGSPTIDYFIGSDAMESANAQEYYTEKLIRLPQLGVCYPKPLLPEDLKSRAYFNLSEDSVIYLCCQMLQKYLPQYDDVFPLIAQQVPQAQFIFFEHISKTVVKLFSTRLTNIFAKYKLDFADYCQIRPKIPKKEYLNFHLVSDVFLDTFGWSGGLTSFDAIACGLPIVTCPGELMCSRQSFGALNIIGVTETIAENKHQYIDLAVKLALNPEWKNEIKDKIKANQNRLFADMSCIKALEKFYEEAIKVYPNKL